MIAEAGQIERADCGASWLRGRAIGWVRTSVFFSVPARPMGVKQFRRYFEAAISVPGPETERLGRAARNACLFLTAGVIERGGSLPGPHDPRTQRLPRRVASLAANSHSAKPSVQPDFLWQCRSLIGL